MNYCVKSVYFIVNITVLWMSVIVSKPYAFMVYGMEFVSNYILHTEITAK